MRRQTAITSRSSAIYFAFCTSHELKVYSSYVYLIRIYLFFSFDKYRMHTYANILRQCEYCEIFYIAFLRNRLHKYTHVENHLLMVRDIRMVKPLNAIIGRYARCAHTGINYICPQYAFSTDGQTNQFSRKSNVRS